MPTTSSGGLLLRLKSTPLKHEEYKKVQDVGMDDIELRRNSSESMKSSSSEDTPSVGDEGRSMEDNDND